MSCRPLVVGGVLVTGVLVGATTMTAPRAQQPASVLRTELQRVELKDTPGKEGIVFVADFPPGAVSPRHSHPGQEFIYVLEGTLIVTPDNQQAVTLKKGETASAPAGQIHTARNSSTSEPTKVLVFMVADKGKPLAIPAEPTQ